MAASCSRVMVSSGPKAVSLYPLTMPFWLAHITASAYQPAVASVKGLSPVTAGEPAKRYRMVTTWARVVVTSGPKVVSLVPCISPRS